MHNNNRNSSSVDSGEAFTGAMTGQLELTGQINLDAAQLVTASSQGLVLETGLHTQAMTNTLTSGQLMESSPAAGGQVVAMVDRSSESSCFSPVNSHCDVLSVLSKQNKIP